MVKKILVPLDGSREAEAVLPEAVQLAECCGAELLLLQVAFAHVFPGLDPTEEEVQVIGNAEGYLAEVAKRLTGSGLPVRTAVRYGRPIAQILDHIASKGVDMVAMSTHGRSGLRHLVMGSVAEAVVRRAAVPVLLLRPRAEQWEPADGAAARAHL